MGKLNALSIKTGSHHADGDGLHHQVQTSKDLSQSIKSCIFAGALAAKTQLDSVFSGLSRWPSQEILKFNIADLFDKMEITDFNEARCRLLMPLDEAYAKLKAEWWALKLHSILIESKIQKARELHSMAA